MPNQPTVLDGLRKEFPAIAQLKLSPDAQQHGQFIDALMAMIQQYISKSTQSTIGQPAGQPAAQSAQSPVGMAGGAPGMGGPPPGGSPMPGMGQPQQIAPGGGGGMSGLAQPLGNMDEIRRMLDSGVNV